MRIWVVKMLHMCKIKHCLSFKYTNDMLPEGQSSKLHICLSFASPVHSLPPARGPSEVLFFVLCPPPHGLEQSDQFPQGDQTQST